MRDLSILEMRQLIVEQLGSEENTHVEMIDPDYNSIEDWKQKMQQNHVYCDETFQQLAADYFRRDLILVCAYQEDGYDQMGRIVKKCNFETNGPPFHLLYYNETRFIEGHFQSIIKKE